jgi:hypothetical protein
MASRFGKRPERARGSRPAGSRIIALPSTRLAGAVEDPAASGRSAPDGVLRLYALRPLRPSAHRSGEGATPFGAPEGVRAAHLRGESGVPTRCKDALLVPDERRRPDRVVKRPSGGSTTGCALDHGHRRTRVAMRMRMSRTRPTAP